jgi:Zn-dependent protease
MVHEFSHRQTAVFYGFQTKFRLVTVGVVITALSVIAGGGFGVPGAVVIVGLDDESTKHQTGVCKSAGPFSNVIFGSILIVLSMALPDSIIIVRIFLLQGALFNFTLGAFNLLPVAILDGANIIRWNIKVWIALVVLCVLGIVAYVLILEVLQMII